MNFRCRVKLYPIITLSLFFLFLFFGFTTTYSEQVGIFKSSTPLNSSDTVKILVPDGIVALSGSVPIEGDSTAGKSNSTSLFFMVDHSGSMYNAYDHLPDCPMDPGYNRMKLVSNIVDSLSAYSNKYPNIECGLGVFGSNLYYDSSNNKLLEELLNEDSSGMYLPLIELNKKYSEAENKTGREIIKELVDIKIDKINYIPTDTSAGLWDITGKDTADYFKYNPGNGEQWFPISLLDRIDTTYIFLPTGHGNWGTGTSIDFGFKAAVEALKKSQNSEKDRFIIFLSDGMGDDDDFKDGFINNKDDAIPTTFTIYFTNSDTAPTLLKEMADSIKINGYSESNPIHTNLKPYKNTTIDALVGYVMDSIISIFEAGKTTKPNKIIINNDTSDLWDANNGYFTFSHALALTGTNTDFPIKLDLTIHKDSIGLNDSIIKVEVDTSFSVLTQAIIDNNLKEDDAEGDIEWWDRNITILSGSSEVDSISEINRTLDVNFIVDYLNSEFRYTKSEISIKCINSGDSLNITLDKDSDTKFDKTIDIDPFGNLSFTDNKLTPDSIDQIVFTFRNSEDYSFPLDTLQKSIYYNLSTKFEITEGALFDDDANGICDRVQLKLIGDKELLQKGADEIAGRIDLPDSRGLTISSTNVKNNILNILVTSSEGINTASNSDDKASIKTNSVVSSGGVLMVSEVELLDSMAPVIVKAVLYDNPLMEVDSFNVEYSEEIKDFDNDYPLNFFNSKNDPYDIKLNKKNIDKKKQKNNIDINLSSKINEGDSVNIKHFAIIADKKNIFQKNEKNLKVEIEIIRSSLDIKANSITFIDPKGSGYPTLVRVDNSYDFSDEGRKNYSDIFKKYLEEIEERDLTVDSVYWDDNDCYLICLQSNDDYIKTIVTEEDIFVADKKIFLSDEVWFSEQVIEPMDSMAPVLTRAICVDSIASDSISHLIMTFSERYNDPGYFNNESPYLFKKGSNIFPIELYYKEYKGKELFTVPNSSLKSEFWEDIDSVRINPDFGITDGVAEQKSDENRLVKLQHMKIAPPLELVLQTTMITKDNPESYIVVSPLNDLSINSDDEIQGTITIIDHVGNHVIKDRPLEYDKSSKKAMLKWDGKNDAGRNVGTAIYPVIANIDSIKKGNVGGDFDNITTLPEHELRGAVGVKY